MGPKKVKLLENSLTASAAGCRTPHAPTLLGPTRIWLSLNTLRSSKVKKATLTKTTRTTIKNSSKNKNAFITVLPGNLNKISNCKFENGDLRQAYQLPPD